MDKILEKNKKVWSLVGLRGSFGLICNELLKEDKDFYIITADVSTSAGLDRLKKQNPDRIIDTGIAEQNMITIAAGMASEGMNVFTTTFAPFQSQRCNEQIKVNLGYMKNKVVMVGLASGIVLGVLGYSHCSIEDVASLRSIPNISITVPSDVIELYYILINSFKIKNSLYIRLTGSNNLPLINDVNYKFSFDKANKILDGEDILIITNGTIINECIKAAKTLKEKNINPAIYNFHTIKPFDEKTLIEISKNYQIIFVVDEHSVFGSLCSCVSEVLATNNINIKQVNIAIQDSYEVSGPYEPLKDSLGISASKITKKILDSF